ncbi:AbrB family transcriptional regulator [Alteribacillus sp. YIM 98480]|uniref:AbrB family transcriptional regulator n=1 Tax=Alteribacillus sp. YIM 98480 TaxID=2606599 RepID=UPI00131E7AE1|nr:AbrB family transcriptional regulator [Alteribacillus sp. YIM 98480]
MSIYEAFLFVIVALLGGYLGRLMRIPIGSVIGAMLCVGLFKIIGVVTFSDTDWLSFVVQVSIGIMLGVSFISLDKGIIKKISAGLMVNLIGIFFMVITIGIIISFGFSMDLKLSILSSAPGAIVEMATMADALQLDSPTVVLVHLFRVIIIMAIFPLLIKWIILKIKQGEKDKA